MSGYTRMLNVIFPIFAYFFFLCQININDAINVKFSNIKTVFGRNLFKKKNHILYHENVMMRQNNGK